MRRAGGGQAWCQSDSGGGPSVVGGNSSSEIRMWTRGAAGAGNLYSEEMGILGELKLRNLQTNPDGNVFFWDEVLLGRPLCRKQPDPPAQRAHYRCPDGGRAGDGR